MAETKEKTTKEVKSASPKTKAVKKETFGVNPEEMAEAGLSMGHRASNAHPKMKPYICGMRNAVHIIDLERTKEKFEETLKFIKRIISEKKTLLFIGTKIQVKDLVKDVAKECDLPYVNERWLGGTLTNFGIISKRLEYFRDLDEKKKKGELKKYTKKEQHQFGVELQKLERQFGGIKKMIKLPEALLIVDVQKEKLAVKEARMKNIPVIGLCDTNADPSIIDYPIPANDDAITSLKLILGTITKVLK